MARGTLAATAVHNVASELQSVSRLSLKVPQPSKTSKNIRENTRSQNRHNLNFRPYLDIFLAQRASQWSPRVPKASTREPNGLPLCNMFCQKMLIFMNPAPNGPDRWAQGATASRNEPDMLQKVTPRPPPSNHRLVNSSSAYHHLYLHILSHTFPAQTEL